MKYAVILGFLAVLASLGTALFFMMRQSRIGDTDTSAKGKRMATALAVRVGVSIVLFLGILVAWQLGWIQPSGLPTTGR